MGKVSKLDNILNDILDNLFDVWIPILYRPMVIVMVIAVAVLTFLGVIMATRSFDLFNPDLIGQLPTGATIYMQASFMLYWPFTAAPLWWKLSFFIVGGLILFPRLLTFLD